MKRALITGVNGFVGSKVRAHLAEQGWDTLGIVRGASREERVFRHDLSQPLPAKLNQEFDVCIHAAARSKPFGRYRRFHEDNVVATKHVIEFCKANSVGKLIHISSASVYYQSQDQFDIVESTPFAAKPINHYAKTKQLADELVRKSDLDWAILRPRAVFGPGDSVLLPRILAAAKTRRLPNFTTSSPTLPIGDLIYIDCLCDYVCKTANDPKVLGEFNLTNNKPIEIQAMLRRLLERLELPTPERTVSVERAIRFAWVLEKLYAVFLPWLEPPITPFGIHVFAYSKTFDVSKTIKILGPPLIEMDDAIERTILDLLR